MKIKITILVFFLSLSIANAQIEKSAALLSNLTVQMECTEAVDALYNFDFETAEKQFLWLKQKYPTHPLPYFLMGLSNWWKIMPNDIVTSYDDVFYAYMDSSITFAEEMLDADANDPEASFFLAGAYGFKARLESDRDNYTAAAFTAKKSLNHLHENREKSSDLGPEFVFGDALYNYYREWIPENMPKLKPILLFFKKGDKEKGLKQLKGVADNAFYTRIEAGTFLMRIYNEYEKEYESAAKYSKYLQESYPQNPYFQRYYARVCFTRGKLNEAFELSQDILRKVATKQVGYDEESGRVASYFSGFVQLKLKRDTAEAERLFTQCVSFTETLSSWDKSIYERGYFLNSLNYLATINKEKGDIDGALEFYKRYVEYAEKKATHYKTAKKYIKENSKEEKGWWKLW